MKTKLLSALLGATALAPTSSVLAQTSRETLPPLIVPAPTDRPRHAAPKPTAAPAVAARARPATRRKLVSETRSVVPPVASVALPPTVTPVTETTAGPVREIQAVTATSSTRTDTPIQEIPQSIQVVPRQLIDQQGAATVSEAVQNVSSVQPANSLGIGNTDFAPLKIRGFPAEQWRDGFVNNYDAGDRDGLVNVERIEVLKGPSAILFGGGVGSPLGGVVNVISKRPKDEAFVQTGVKVGSFGYWNPWIDINQPLNDDRTVLFRVTGEYIGNRSFVDVLNSRRYNINPTLTLTNRQDTTLTIQGFVTRQQQQSYPGLPVYGTILGDFRVPTNTYLGPRNTPDSYSENAGIVMTLDHQFNDVWSANVRGRWSRTQFDQLTQNLFGGDATGAVPAIPPATWFLQNLELFQKQEEFTINPTIKASFAAGPTRNVFLAGVDYSKIKDTGFMTGDNLGNTCYFMTFDPVTCPPATVDLTNPIFWRPVTKPSLASGMEFARYFDYRNQYVTKGAYTQLQSTWFERIHLLGGVRVANISIDYLENALSPAQLIQTRKTKALPRVGAVVDLFSGISAYASYTEGMRWIGFNTAVSNPQPETSRQAEAGLKFNLFENTLTGTLAFYDIHRSNVPVTVALGVAALSEQQSKGFEADVIWQPTRNWSFLGSYGFTYATFGSPFNDFNGGMVPAGNRLPFVPASSGRLWANYKFDPDLLPGLSIGAGVYAASSQYVDPANKWKTSGYFTVDSRIGYERDNWRASLSVKNLTGEKYLTPYAWLGGQVAPGAPRMFYAEISYLFK